MFYNRKIHDTWLRCTYPYNIITPLRRNTLPLHHMGKLMRLRIVAPRVLQLLANYVRHRDVIPSSVLAPRGPGALSL